MSEKLTKIIKPLNYNKDTIPEEDKNSLSSRHSRKNQNIFNNLDNNIIASLDINEYNKSSFGQNKYHITNVMRSLEPDNNINKSFSEEVELSFEKNNTLMNDSNSLLNNEKIYKKILENNAKKKDAIRPFKIIKCEKVFQSNSNRNNKINNIIFESKLNKANKNNKKNLILNTDMIITTNVNSDLENNNLNKYINENNKISESFNDNYVCDCDINNNYINYTERCDKKNLFRKTLSKNPNSEIAKKIKDKGYIDSLDFMKVVNEDNNINKKKNNFNQNNLVKCDKKIIEVLKKINLDKNKKLCHKDKKENYNKNMQENNNLIINNHRKIKKNNINDKNKGNGIEKFEKEIVELKQNLFMKNYNKGNINYTNKENKSLKLKRESYKLYKYKMILDERKDNEIDINKQLNINKLYKNKNFEKEMQKRQELNQKYKNVILKKNLRRLQPKEINSKNHFVLKSRNVGINLTNKIKKYNSIKNKTIEDINNINNNLINKNKNINDINNNSKNINITNNNYSIKKISKTDMNLNKLNLTEINNSNNDSELNSCLISNNIQKNNKTMINHYNSKTNLSNYTDINSKMNTTQIATTNLLIKYKNDISCSKQNLNLTTGAQTFTKINNSKDNELNYIKKDLLKDINSNDNNQIKSCESQVLSGINGPNTTLYSFLNKSDVKSLNKINLDMPNVNIDLDKEEIGENIDEKKEKKIFSYKDNKKIKIINDKKMEKLENFIIELNEDEKKDERNKEINIVSNIPTYGKSIAEINISINEEESNINSNNDNKDNNNNNEQLFLKEKNNNSNIENINEKEVNIEKDNNEINFDNMINNENEENNNININNEQSFKSKKLNLMDINIDLPNNDQDFLDDIELIQKNNFRWISPKEKGKEENKYNTQTKTVKDLESEIEFNIDEEKFYKPLQKYADKFEFNKVNPF